MMFDPAEWEVATVSALSRKTRLPRRALAVIVEQGVRAVRPDLEQRTSDQRTAAARLVEWLLPRIRRAERRRAR
jgi:hypothetical protein